MRDGDISNIPEGKLIYVVWEGLLAVPTERYTATRFRRRLRFRNPTRALELYKTNDLAVDQLWRLWAEDQQVAVVTFLGERVAPALAERLADDAVPCARLIATTVSHLASHVASEPDVLHVVDPEPLRRLTYGSMGRYIAAHDAALIGRLL
ncbi:hypothetical protein ACIGXM_14205 [Kitasatospora sp. NPDC052896]|uniref:hypothetical protein n=1 Tax=Kitasatospora sp. NPDC052896 TaxID=3364061 RepID=UPI0037CA0F4F